MKIPGNDFCIRDEKGKVVIQVKEGYLPSESEQILMAAAPEMLAVLKGEIKFLANLRTWGNLREADYEYATLRAQAVSEIIAKAEKE